VPYKKVGLIVDAFAAMPQHKLVVIGDGPELDGIRARCPANVTLLGYQSGAVLRDHLQRAKAFVFAAEEDFGIAPLEAQACGTPVIAFGKGGALETIIGQDHPSPTGVFFDEQSVPAIIAAVARFESMRGSFNPQHCRENALRFAPARFAQELTRLVQTEWEQFQEASAETSGGRAPRAPLRIARP
jgi:glycosyltransferase involved in cell wall biosynthesis